jgi:Mg2+ and Co2+ transporter CorA
VEAKRSFSELKNVKISTLVGMVYISLTFICGLFSMSYDILPGSDDVWAYLAPTVWLIVVVFLVSVLANRGNDGNAVT